MKYGESPYARMPIDERFWSKVQKSTEPDGCWLWTGFINPDGYGTFRIGSRTDDTRREIHAHRWIWEYLHGPLPPGYEPDHTCRNPSCVRPDHLEAVTHKVNSQRADHSNVSWWQKAKTHCPRGHEYSEANTKIDGRGGRRCRACDALAHRLARTSKHQNT